MAYSRMTDLDRAVRLNAAASYLMKGLSILVGLAVVPAYMRYFESREVLGVWYTIQTVLQWVLMFDLGLGNGLRNKLAAAVATGDREAVSGYVSSSYRLLGCLSVALGIAIFLMAPLVPWNALFNVPAALVSPNTLAVCMCVVGLGVVAQLFLQLVNGILYALQLSAAVNAIGLTSNALILLFVSIAPGGGDGESLVLLGAVNVACMLLPLAVATAVVFRGGLLGVPVSWGSFSWSCARGALSTGAVILFLQLVWMFVASTHSVLISLLRGPEEVVEYQLYFKVFSTLSSLAAIALAPVWSAVTAAAAEGRYGWIRRVYAKGALLALGVGAICAVVAPFLQLGFDVWLGGESIRVDGLCTFSMSALAVTLVLQNVNASIGNGLSFFRVQVILMSLAAVLMIPLSGALCLLTGSWAGVVLAMVVATAPFQIIEPVACLRHLRSLEAGAAAARPRAGRSVSRGDV